MLTQEHLHECLRYNPDTGVFHWISRPLSHFSSVRFQKSFNNKMSGSMAGFVMNKGYIHISIDGVQYLGHRLAWLYVYGVMPEIEIDHKNGIRTDNRIDNLRSVDRKTNMENKARYSNNTSGFHGVHQIKKSGKWQARIYIDGKRVSLGCFDDFKSAVEARINAERDIGYHENHGRLS